MTEYKSLKTAFSGLKLPEGFDTEQFPIPLNKIRQPSLLHPVMTRDELTKMFGSEIPDLNALTRTSK